MHLQHILLEGFHPRVQEKVLRQSSIEVSEEKDLLLPLGQQAGDLREPSRVPGAEVRSANRADLLPHLPVEASVGLLEVSGDLSVRKAGPLVHLIWPAEVHSAASMEALEAFIAVFPEGSTVVALEVFTEEGVFTGKPKRKEEIGRRTLAGPPFF